MLLEDKDKGRGDAVGKAPYTGPMLDPTTGNIKSADGTPFMGPVDKTGTTSSLGLLGKTRFDYVMGQAGRGAPLTANGPDYDTWVLSLPEDPNDIAYTQLLRQAKQAALARQRVRAQVSAGEKQWKITGKPATPEEVKAAQQQAQQAGQAGQPSTPWASWTGAPPPVDPPVSGLNKSQTEKQKRADEAAYKQAQSGKAMVFGMPIDATAPGVGIGGPAAPGTPKDPYVERWLQGEELNTDARNTQFVTSSGQWVYTGEQQDPNGPAGFTRPSYTYYEDAESMITGLPVGQIKAYQHKLGLPETGVVGVDLQGLWHDAVVQAQKYAMQGQKVTLQFIFDSVVADAIAKRGAVGGGGGSQWADETPEDLAGADYYMAMMQVLGDISGVGSGQA